MRQGASRCVMVRQGAARCAKAPSATRQHSPGRGRPLGTGLRCFPLGQVLASATDQAVNLRLLRPTRPHPPASRPKVCHSASRYLNPHQGPFRHQAGARAPPPPPEGLYPRTGGVPKFPCRDTKPRLRFHASCVVQPRRLPKNPMSAGVRSWTARTMVELWHLCWTLFKVECSSLQRSAAGEEGETNCGKCTGEPAGRHDRPTNRFDSF